MIDPAYVQRLKHRLGEVETELSEPATASDQQRFRRLMEEHAHLRKIEERAEHFFRLKEDAQESRDLLAAEDSDDELRAMAEEECARCEAALPDAERRLMVALLPPRPEDSRNTIVEIRAGTGGDEAALFAADLFRMYTRYGETQEWKTGIIDAGASSIGGYKEIIFSVEGRNVYRNLRYESGVHRVQRIPVTETSGRIHTSAATVAVLPEAEDIEVDIKQEELRIDIFRSSGPGGQSVNTTDSAVRITHLPSGIVVQCQDEKSQHRNREKAMRVLRARLLDHLQSEEEARRGSTRRSQVGSGDRSERIRTYNFPQNRVTDHRINLTLYSLDRVMAGELDELIGTLRDRDIEDRLTQEMQTQ
jgi:peptide chain release factor 1